MSILGIDYGKKKIGFAKSDSARHMALPLNVAHVESAEDAIETIDQVCRVEEIEEIVIGIPYRMDGGDSEQTQEVKQFADQLERELGIAVTQIDERLSSQAAQQLLREQGGEDDAVAAMLILQTYLDQQAHE